MKQKWVEAMLFDRPSHNFSRPCGSVDRCSIDQTTIVCDSFAGDLRWPNAPCNCNDSTATAGPTPTDCPTDAGCSPLPISSIYKWDDNTIKGDYVIRVLSYNYRDVGEIARLRAQYELWRDVDTGCDLSLLTYPDVIRSGSPLTEISVTQHCAQFDNCNPVPITLAPLALTIDEHYTSFAYRDIQQWMVDPLWQMPVDCDDDPFTGDPPYEEARCTLPGGLTLGCVNTGSTDAPNWVGPMCGGASLTDSYFTPWTRIEDLNPVDFDP